MHLGLSYMAWLSTKSAPLMAATQRNSPPDGMWRSCQNCSLISLSKDFSKNLNVCPECDFHYPLSVKQRIEMLVDESSFKEFDQELKSIDPLKFHDSKSYCDRLKAVQKKTGRNDAFVSGSCSIGAIKIQLGIFDFEFMGGSMGSVVGEKISRLFLRAAETLTPAIIITSSGGARMQEGIISLFQMAKTCAALSRLRDVGLPFISILCHPTTGGVAASFAMLGDLNLGEPNALIGFAGPRVIQQTIGAKLPEGFQTAEYLLDHGMLDFISHRNTMRDELSKLLRLLLVKKL